MSAWLHSTTLTLLVVTAACGPEAEPVPERLALQLDDRLEWLLQPAARNEYYDADTSDTIGILSEVLKHGQRDPLKRARKEMADEGPAGVAAAERMIEATWNDPGRFADIRNALDVLAYSSTPEAHKVIAHVLQHESASPRQAAWRALRPVAGPEDYDRLRELLDLEDTEFGPELSVLLAVADPQRAALEYMDWIENGSYTWLRLDVIRNVPETAGAEIQRRACELYGTQEGVVQLMLAASCARSGDPAALALLREWQQSDKPGMRQAAIESLMAAELFGELGWTLERDPDSRNRLRAAQTIGSRMEPEGARTLLEAGMNDADADVAANCVAALIQVGHGAAIERAFQDLSSDRVGAMESALLSLRVLLERDPALAERAFERLRTRYQDESYAGLARCRPSLRAMGMVPSASASEFLYELSQAATGKIQTIDAARWVVLQMGNGGEPAQRYMISRLESERDPWRRLDLIESLSATATPLAFDWLIARAQAEDVSPYELLYVADRLTRVGPTRIVAPVLKRATLRVDQNDVRRALQGLLWTWYPIARPR